MLHLTIKSISSDKPYFITDSKSLCYIHGDADEKQRVLQEWARWRLHWRQIKQCLINMSKMMIEMVMMVMVMIGCNVCRKLELHEDRWILPLASSSATQHYSNAMLMTIMLIMMEHFCWTNDNGFNVVEICCFCRLLFLGPLDSLRFETRNELGLRWQLIDPHIQSISKPTLLIDPH